ncbi:MAG: SHOCT domain-containing protein [Clostridia bacterium]|nr:SHOCT domain-containing protein [Clostridia bacterium]
MEDKIIIKSEKYEVKNIFKYTLIFGVVFFVLMFFGHLGDGLEYYFDWDGLLGAICLPEQLWGQIFYSFLVPLFLAYVIYQWLKSYELTITEKRAYGFAAFGRRVDLPMDSVSAIGLGWLKSIKITTASGKISFFLIKNRDEMYETMSKLIIERQAEKPKVETVVKQEVSNADELKKYKDLLDGGVISQEEFDQKKKQLLGL